MHSRIVVALISFCTVCIGVAAAQTILVDSNTRTNNVNGWHPLYEMKVDPDNANNMILCGARSDSKDNAFYGFVYSSADGGKTWTQALEDKNSSFESEHSCAFGTNGVAYYLASASKVIDGTAHHDQGITRIYVSRNSGKTWKVGVQTGWTDYSTAVVDTHPGPNQNRLYVFFNNLRTFYNSVGNNEAMNTEAKISNGTRIGLVSYRDGDAQVAGPFTNAEMKKEGFHGSYPTPSFLLNDGSILTFFSTKRRTEKNERELVAYSVRTAVDRTSLEAPVKLVSSLGSPADNSDVRCAGYYLGSGGAYDPVHDKLYFAYSEVHNKGCQLFLTTSSDGGRTWSKAARVWSPKGVAESAYANLEIAVNRENSLGVLWRDNGRAGCWRFATSTDSGKTLSRSADLGDCTEDPVTPSILTSAYLWTSILQTDATIPGSETTINLRNARNSVWRNQGAVATSADGKFHVVWADAGSGNGELRAASITVIPAEKLIEDGTQGLADKTTNVSVLYGGDQSYDTDNKTLTLEVTVRNNGDLPLRGPFKLAVPDINDFGFADIANADNKVSGAGAVWDISSAISDGSLAPGAISKPFALKFHYFAKPDTPRDSDDIFGLTVRLYAGK